MRKKTNNEFINEVNEKCPTVEVLSKYEKYNVKVNCKCRICGWLWQITPAHLLSGEKCPKCAKNTLKSQEEFVSEMLVKNPNIEIIGSYKGAKEYIKCKCKLCTGVWDGLPTDLLKGCGCPICCKSPRRVSNGINSMWDTSPETAKLLLNPEDGFLYTSQSNTSTDWVCPNCGSVVRNKKIVDIYKKGVRCPACSEGVSYPTRYMANLLNGLNINYETEKYFKWLNFRYKDTNRGGRFDFYFKINDKEYVVEMDGKYHYTGNKLCKQTANDIKEVDRLKDELAEQHNVCVIRIDARESQHKYLMTQIINSKLNTLFNLNLMDWNKCGISAISRTAIECAKLWDDKNSIRAIADKYKKHPDTIYKWLKECRSLGICS